jgi:glyceraldehyde-3-phosphate dehydrogenase type I
MAWALYRTLDNPAGRTVSPPTDTHVTSSLLPSRYDSILGTFKADIKITGDDTMTLNGRTIKVVSQRNPLELPWKEMGIDIVIESTGVFIDEEGAGKHITAGAKKVVITAPGKGKIPTYVLGVNAHEMTGKEPIVSNASCTTNGMACWVKVRALSLSRIPPLPQRNATSFFESPTRARRAFP